MAWLLRGYSLSPAGRDKRSGGLSVVGETCRSEMTAILGLLPCEMTAIVLLLSVK